MKFLGENFFEKKFSPNPFQKASIWAGKDKVQLKSFVRNFSCTFYFSVSQEQSLQKESNKEYEKTPQNGEFKKSAPNFVNSFV